MYQLPEQCAQEILWYERKMLSYYDDDDDDDYYYYFPFYSHWIQCD